MRGGFFYALLSLCVFGGAWWGFCNIPARGGDGFCCKIWLFYSTKLGFCGCCKHVFANNNFPCSQQAFSLPRVRFFVLFASGSACCATRFCSAIFASLCLVTKPTHTPAISYPVCGFLCPCIVQGISFKRYVSHIVCWNAVGKELRQNNP